MDRILSFLLFEKEVYSNSKGGKFWGDVGAGVLALCEETKRFLVVLRSKDVNEPGTWGTIGGMVDRGEKIKDAAAREFVEETGYDGDIFLVPAYVFKSPDKKFKYHNFIGIVDKEFETNPDWETERTEWMTLDELRALKNKHFGLESLLDNFDFDKLKPKNE